MENSDKKMYVALEKTLGNQDEKEVALKLYGAKEKIHINYKDMPHGKTGYMHPNGKTIDINRNMRKGARFYALSHELEHWKHKDYKKRIRGAIPATRESIESERHRAAASRLRDWNDMQLQQKEFLKKNQKVAE